MPTRESERRGVGPAAKEVAEHASTLARLELELAALEVKRKVAALGVGIGLVIGAGATGVNVPDTGFSSVGASPRARAAMRLGFSLRRNAASSASGSASFPLSPF